MVRNLSIFPDNCSGCRACELACAYHHSDYFNRKTSSIQIKRNEKKGKFEIILHNDPIEERFACDKCINKKEPLCAKFCLKGAITYDPEGE